MALAFMSLRASRNNLGDILIRREAVRLLAERGYSIVAYGRDMHADYLSAIANHPECHVVNQRSVFLRRIINAAFRGDSLFVMAPAPSKVASGVRTTIKQFAFLLFLVAWRISGNEVAYLGRAVRGNAAIGVLIEKAISRLAQVYLVRDHISRNIVGPVAQVCPDISMLAPLPEISGTAERNILAVEVRGDRPGDPIEFLQLKAKAADNGLQLVFIAQVAEDADNMARTAAALDCRVVDWRGGSGHVEHEVALGELYSRCAAVYSDRLHVLINGARHGAFPIVRRWPGDDKLFPTLAAIPTIQYGVGPRGLDRITSPDDVLEGVRQARDCAKRSYSQLPSVDAQRRPSGRAAKKTVGN